MSGHISTEIRTREEREEALAFLDQARHFYASAGSHASANPLLYYYAFLNLAKPLIRVRGFAGRLDRAYHGLTTERVGSGNSPADFRVVVEGQHRGRVNVFKELSICLGLGSPPSGPYPVENLMSQVVVGHRLWRQASREKERFVGLHKVEMRQDKATSEMWLRLLVLRSDLDRFSLSQKTVLEEGRLARDFQKVMGAGIPPDCAAFEQMRAIYYGHRPNDHLDGMVDGLRDRLWRIVSADPEQGYRSYYVHLTPDTQLRLPQFCSMWALLFHYGSIVRYQPHRFATMAKGTYGAFIQEFVAAQPEQLLYLLASEMCQREVAKPAIA
jgi:hypothetical protein